MKRALAALACRLGLAALCRRRARGRLLILMYHGVVERPLRPFCWHQLPVDAFRAQLAWIGERYTVLPLAEALERLAANSLPPHACAITFDDGYRNNATVAAPVLRALDLPATIFLPTEVVGTDGLLWPDRLRVALAAARVPSLDLGALGLGVRSLASEPDRAAAIQAALRVLKARPRAEKDEILDALVRAADPDATGDDDAFALLSWEEVADLRAHTGGRITFGPHSTTHEILSRCEDDVVIAQVEASCRALAESQGTPPVAFAYPNGRAIDFDDRAREAIRAAGVPWALSTVEGLNGPETDPLALRRVPVGADLPLPYFKLLASGWRDSH